jgi:anion-transporting  ArsA/GET3 family ATPase
VNPAGLAPAASRDTTTGGARLAADPRRVTGIAERLDGKRICIVAGSGGVGKTTASAAVGLGLAAAGQRVAVITIDPARRLAESLGLEQLGNDPRRVDSELLAAHGVEMRGELWAMMLDPKATFDDLIARLSPDTATRDDVLNNRIYKQLSSAVAGSQDFTAVAKLYDLHHAGGFDVLVLDTPPSRNALDFLDAPDRLTDFFEGRALKIVLVPTGIAAKIMSRGTSVVFSILKRLTGVDLMDDIAVFLRALGGLMDGFKDRAAGVKALLADPATTFLIVTSPEREPVAEAIFFRGKLREARMAFGGLIVNRVNLAGDHGDDPETVGAQLRAAGLDRAIAAKVVQSVADLRRLAARDAQQIERLKDELDEPDPIVVPRLDGDVQDIDGLLALRDALM